jgi:hypothetical protein
MNTMNRRDLLKGLSAAGVVAAVAPVAFESEKVARFSSDIGSKLIRFYDCNFTSAACDFGHGFYIEFNSCGGLPDGIKNSVVYRAIDGSLMAGTYE